MGFCRLLLAKTEVDKANGESLLHNNEDIIVIM
jgi:hypothetical protein